MTERRLSRTEGLARRELLGKGLSFAAWGTVFTLGGGGVAESVRFLFPSVVFRPPSTYEVGRLDDFATSSDGADEYGVIGVESRFVKEHRFFVVREADRLYAMFARCPHLGCTVNWFPSLNIFKCPCHGSQFRSNGENFAGPAPRSLDRLRIFVNGRENIVVDTSLVYSGRELESREAYVELV